MPKALLPRRLVLTALAVLVIPLFAAGLGLGVPQSPADIAQAQSPALQVVPESGTLSLPSEAVNSSPSPSRLSALADGWATLMSEGFEGPLPAGGWALWPPNADYSWGRRNCQAHGGSYSALGHGGGSSGSSEPCSSGYPANIANNSLIYGPFSLEGATAAELSFWLNLNTQQDGDRIYYWVSLDANNFHGYWVNGTTSGWEPVTLDLANVPNLGSVLDHDRVWIAFSVFSDATVGGQGAFIDDVVLRASGATTGPRQTFLPAVMGGRPLEQASQAVSSGESATISTTTGVSVIVPNGAVALTADGQPGTMTFSVEEYTSAAPPPAGFSPLGNAYSFGPSGFNFAAPVTVTFPVPVGVDMAGVGIMRYDEVAGQWEMAPATLDAGARTVSTGTQHFTGFRPVESDTYRDQGWFHWSTSRGAGGEGILGAWMCVATADLSSGASTAQVAWPQWQRSVPLVTDAGWADNSLPKGRYTFFYRWGGPDEASIRYAETGPIDITSSVATTVSLTLPPTSGTVKQGYPPCLGVPNNGQPDYSVGTGEVQVTLNWNATVDLDLHVTEPSGEQIYYDHPYSGTNGQLDLDNRCSNFVTGRPENIFWPPAGSGGAPSGHYLVQVAWYDNCSGAATEVPFSVRVVIRGRVFTFRKVFTGGPNPSDYMTVATCLKQPASSGETPLCW